MKYYSQNLMNPKIFRSFEFTRILYGIMDHNSDVFSIFQVSHSWKLNLHKIPECNQTVKVLNFVFEAKCEVTFPVTMQKLQSAALRTAK